MGRGKLACLSIQIKKTTQAEGVGRALGTTNAKRNSERSEVNPIALERITERSEVNPIALERITEHSEVNPIALERITERSEVNPIT